VSRSAAKRWRGLQPTDDGTKALTAQAAGPAHSHEGVVGSVE
jgi:hypothetical protein